MHHSCSFKAFPSAIKLWNISMLYLFLLIFSLQYDFALCVVICVVTLTKERNESHTEKKVINSKMIPLDL